MTSVKTIKIDEETWKKLAILKIRLGKRSLREVIQELLDMMEREETLFRGEEGSEQERPRTLLEELRQRARRREVDGGVQEL